MISRFQCRFTKKENLLTRTLYFPFFTRKAIALSKLRLFSKAYQILSEVLCGHNLPSRDGTGKFVQGSGDLVRTFVFEQC